MEDFVSVIDIRKPGIRVKIINGIMKGETGVIQSPLPKDKKRYDVLIDSHNGLYKDVSISCLVEDLDYENSVEGILNVLPDEALFAYRNKTSYSFIEKYSLNDDWVPYYCEDCYTWHKSSFYNEFEVEEGTGIFWNFIVECDQDGNHEIIEQVDVLSDEYKRLQDEYFNCDKEKNAWDEYIKWVAKTGEDPLDQMCVDLTQKILYHFGIHLEDNSVIVDYIADSVNRIIYTHNAKESKYAYFTYKKRLPQEVKQFFHIKTEKNKWVIHIKDSAGKPYSTDEVEAIVKPYMSNGVFIYQSFSTSECRKIIKAYAKMLIAKNEIAIRG